MIFIKLLLKTYILILKNLKIQPNIKIKHPLLKYHKFLKLILIMITKHHLPPTLTIIPNIKHYYHTPKLYARRKRRLYRRAYQPN